MALNLPLDIPLKRTRKPENRKTPVVGGIIGSGINIALKTKLSDLGELK